MCGVETRIQKIRQQKLISTALLLFWMTIIFLMSSRNADVSTLDSHRIGTIVATIIRLVKPSFSIAGLVEMMDHAIRKTAHMSEYLILAMLLMNCLQAYGIKHRPGGRYAMAIGALYALTDEVHQYFVPGRSCQLSDVLIDSVGVFLGVCLFSIIIKSKLKNQGNEKFKH